MKQWKWLAAVALCLAAMLAGFACAEDGFTVDDGVLTGYTGSETAIVIPDDLGITSIDARAFYNRSDITSVTVPEGDGHRQQRLSQLPRPDRADPAGGP